jgi:osmotically-inducible protein OsmY
LVREKNRFVSADPIRVHITAHVATLEGVVPSDLIREMAECDAWYVFGVDQVINRLAIQ